MAWTLHQGDCLQVLPTLEDASVDAVVTDPPYPCINRDYGRWTEEEWFALMDPVVEHCRRVLKPTGSAVFILQPNSERVGRMRPWLWEFMAKWGREWGIVQDAWWLNTSAIPEANSIQGRLMRPSLKACVWLGPPDCWRDQDAVLWQESQSSAYGRMAGRCRNEKLPSGHRVNDRSMSSASVRRGGVLPFNVLPMGNDARWNSGTSGHGAVTPLALMRWWVRYICPPGGVVLDPFAGSGTLGLACEAEGRDSVMVERHGPYCEIIRRRMAEADGQTPLFAQQ